MARLKKDPSKQKTRERKKTQDAPEQSDNAENEEAKKPPSKHTWEGSYLIKKHKPGCLNRHVSWYAASNTCSHRGQARKQAQGDFAMYLRSGDASLPPQQDEWDPRTPGNFAKSASTPFAHEAHHVVAAAELKTAISKVSKGIEPENGVLLMMRGGLLKEKYNINDQLNMLILPMDLDAVKTLGLPLHRKTPAHRSHNSYNTYIKDELEKKFKWLKKAADKHEVPPYESTKAAIESLSKTTYLKIKGAGKRLKNSKAGEDKNDLDSLTPHIKTQNVSSTMMSGPSP